MTWHRFPDVGRKVRRSLAPGLILAPCLIFVGLSSCGSSSTAPQTSSVRVLLTDAPSDMLESADVWISRVYLQGGGGTEPDTMTADSTAADSTAADTTSSERVDLFNDPSNPIMLDVLTLQDSVTADLTGLVTVDAANYQGLRLVVDSARVTLKAPLTFMDGSSSAVLKTPSGSTSGIKVKIADILQAMAGDTTTVTVDFNVDSNFVIQMNQPSGQVRQILFTPVLTERSRTTAKP